MIMIVTYSIAIFGLFYFIGFIVFAFGFKKMGYNLIQSLFLGLAYPALTCLELTLEGLKNLILILGGTNDAELSQRFVKILLELRGEE